MRTPRPTALALAALLLGACGGAPAVLRGVDGLSDDDRARITDFDTTLDAEHIAALVPDDAPQRFDLRPGSLVESGLGRYLPILAADLAAAMRDFEAESGVPALEAFDRLLFWSAAPTVDEMTRARAEVLVALDGETLVELIAWMERTPTSKPAEDEGDDDPHTGAMFVAAFTALDPGQLATVRRVMEDDPQRVRSYALGSETRLVTARGGAPPEAWTMWAFSWPGGFMAERGITGDLADPPTALRRLAGHLRRVEAAAQARPRAQPADRVLTARVQSPEPIELELDMGERVGLQLAAPTALFDLRMPPAMLAAAWPMMRQRMVGAFERGLPGAAAGFGPLLAGALRVSELRVDVDRFVLSTTLPRRAFEALLPML